MERLHDRCQVKCQDSNLLHCDICTACDSRADRGLALALSRPARRAVFAVWVHFMWSDCPPLAIDCSEKACNFIATPAGRMNARTADYAGAWLQETDRLETARDRGEPPHHRLRDHDAGPYPEGRRNRRDPDRADRNTARPHRARRVVRGRRILYADVL